MILLFYIIPGLLGASVGSFIHCAVWRIKQRLSIVNGRSQCPHCAEQLKWHDNVPIISFLYLRGRCRSCKKPIAWRYLWVEIICSALFIFTALYHQVLTHGVGLTIIRDWLIISLLVFTFLYDLLYEEILDAATVIPAAIVFALSLIFEWQTLSSLLIGAAVGTGFFLVQYFVSRGRWIGQGDIFLGLFMGVIVGWPHILLALLLAYVLGAAGSLILIGIKKKTLTSRTAFGTYLAVGTVITMFFGDMIISWYLQFLL